MGDYTVVDCAPLSEKENRNNVNQTESCQGIETSTSNTNMLTKMFKNRKVLEEEDFAFNYGASKIVVLMHNSWLKQLMCDVTIKTIDYDIMAQRIVLSALSPKLSSLFSTTSRKAETILFVNTSREIVALVLNYLYTCDIDLNCRIIKDVVTCARDLDLTVVLLVCTDYLKETVDSNNFLLYYSIAVNNCLEIQHYLKQFVIKNFILLQNHPHFRLLPYDHLKLIIKDKKLILDVQTILETVIRWIEYDKTNRLQYIEDFISCITPGSRLSIENVDSLYDKYDWLMYDVKSRDAFLKLYGFVGLFV